MERRRLGMGLIAFGVAGLVLIGSAGALVLASLSAVGDAATGFEQQRAKVVEMLGPASAALERAASSASNAGTSLTETRDSAAQAATLMARLSESFDSLAALGSFEILGARPFAGLSGQFSQVATESRTLSADLARSADAMDTNITDSAAVAADLRTLADQLAELETSLGAPPEGSPGAGNPTLPVDLAKLVLVGLLLWFAVPALVSIWIGWRWYRPSRARRRPKRERG
ncbi:MAG TPA: hypothetical protein VHR16_02160 [Candidatus Limnocylindrales bacterium]|jgi:hypothetical protein|nr:hypothetical protein [Candidatus Limnocylindrales bacterium]